MIRLLVCIMLMVSAAPAGAANLVDYDAPKSITVMASSSLTNVMTELIRNYSTREELSIIAIYDSPSELEYNIRAGDIADVYIAEHATVLRDLKRSGALNVYSIVDVARNELVMIASNKSRLSKLVEEKMPIDKALKIISQRTLLHIGSPEITWMGQVTKQAMQAMGKWAISKHILVQVGSARNVLYLVDKGESVGVVYKTDAMTNSNVKVLADFDGSQHEPILYQAALIAGENMKRAEGFLNYLKSDEAKAVFKRYGFLPL
jgi:molybdate transport system substrate-binding protein